MLSGLGLFISGLSANAEVKLVSLRDPIQTPIAGGNGSSVCSIMTLDGRYVVFASTARNLVVNSNAPSINGGFPDHINVFRRDRTTQTTILVSVNLHGDGGNQNSFPAAISDDGRFVLFESQASDLVNGDTNKASDIFLRDVASNLTTLISVGTNGIVGNGASRSAVMTPDGRYVAFASAANNLVSTDTNGLVDVFVRDRQAGTTELASMGAMGFPVFSISDTPVISANGRYVAFYSTATNLVQNGPLLPNGPFNWSHIYVRDLMAGNTIWASDAASNIIMTVFGSTNVACFGHVISGDGQYVGFEAVHGFEASTNRSGVILRFNLSNETTELAATNGALIPSNSENFRSLNISPDGRFIVFVAATNSGGNNNTFISYWDALTGLQTLASPTTSNSIPLNAFADWPVIDPTGRYVTFISTGGGQVTNIIDGGFHVYRRDVQTSSTVLVDAETNGLGNAVIGPLTMPQMSTNGQFISFEASGADLVTNDRNRESDVFVRDMAAGTVELISQGDQSIPASAANGASVLFPFSISSNGRYIAFASEADNLIANDSNGYADVFVRDTLAGTNLLVSVSTNGTPANHRSTEPSISSDGRYVAFTSHASDLVTGDTNNRSDVFVRDTLSGTTTLVSVSSNGISPGNNPSYSPLISGDGTYVLFRSQAANLVSNIVSGTENLFLRNLQTGTTYGLSGGGISTAAMSKDGRFVVFWGAVTNPALSHLYLWDSQSNALVYTNGTSINPNLVAVSPDGSRVAYTTVNQLSVIDRAVNTNWQISPALGVAGNNLSFSSDSRFLAYRGLPFLGATNQIYLFDFQTKSNLLISIASNGVDFGDDDSDFPQISDDGKFIAYRSRATNLIPGDTNHVTQIFVNEIANGNRILISTAGKANRAANGYSFSPSFSADGKTLFFESWATDLSTFDKSALSDIFSYDLRPSASANSFSVTSFADPVSAGVIWITWPVSPGGAYAVQYKDRLDAGGWSELPGPIELVGSQGYFRDSTQTGQRFYRVVRY